jgi:glycosyltransferase involved in cell wall biosynthesis
MRYKGAKVPKLSVVIACFRSRGTIESCLRSLERQTCSLHEVIVVDSGGDGTAHLIARQFPWVRLLAFDERKYPGDARNAGIRHATGEIIAFLDADCVADDNWAREIMLAHEESDAIIGGSVANANPESYVGWAAYFCEFSLWMPAGAPRRMTDVPTLSLSMKRWAFDKYGPFLEGTYCSDTAFNWRAGQDGIFPLFQPSIRVSHVNLTRPGRFLRKQVMHGRAFATVRIKEEKLNWVKTTVLTLGFPALPFVLFSRIVARVVRFRQFPWQLVTVWPFLLLGLTAWSWGECIGYWRGLASIRCVAGTPESLEPSA